MLAQVTSVGKTGYHVRAEGETLFCLVNNSFKSDTPPIVNDVVEIERREDKYFILDVKPRKSVISRYDETKGRHQNFAANVDVMFIVTSANREFSLERIRRFVALAEDQPVRVVVVLTKVDQNPGDTQRKLLKGEGLDYIAINAQNPRDAARLLDYWKPGEAAMLVGSSGVGKSTLINTLAGLNLKTRDAQSDRRHNKGRHTTSARTMYELPCGRKIIDNPGVKIVGVFV